MTFWRFVLDTTHRVTVTTDADKYSRFKRSSRKSSLRRLYHDDQHILSFKFSIIVIKSLPLKLIGKTSETPCSLATIFLFLSTKHLCTFFRSLRTSSLKYSLRTRRPCRYTGGLPVGIDIHLLDLERFRVLVKRKWRSFWLEVAWEGKAVVYNKKVRVVREPKIDAADKNNNLYHTILNRKLITI